MILIAILAGLIGPTALATRAEALTAQVQRAYWDPARAHYLESISDSGEKASEPAFAWDMAVQMSALAAACAVSPAAYRAHYDRAFESLKPYGSGYAGVFGYAVLPTGAEAMPDRFYDDNAWIALAQLDAYDALKSKKYLRDAQKTFMFVMSGESADLGGGLFWREKERHSKNTCSNAPAIAAATRLYLATNDRQYLSIALRLRKWVRTLKDSDDLMFDNVSLDGRVDKTKWTYNTALMIRADLLLYDATHDPACLAEAVAMGKAAVSHWVDASTGAIHDEASFAHHLAEAFLALAAHDNSMPWRDIAIRAIDAAYDVGGRDQRFGLRWDRYEVRDHKLILLYQASMERALWMASMARPESDGKTR